MSPATAGGGSVGRQPAIAADLAVERLVTFLRCSTAEEYFAVLDVGYDPAVLAPNRLPILRMFSAELARIERPGGDRAHAAQEGPSRPPQLDPVTRLSLYRDALRRSYLASACRYDRDRHHAVAATTDVPAAFVGIDEIMTERTREGRQ